MNAQDKIAKTLTAGVMITALVVSFMHIVITFTALGAGWDRWIAPLMIDTIAIIGKIYSGSRYTAPTRRAGRAAFYVAGTLSLIANVMAGYLEGHYGSMIIGVITVTAALWGEFMISLGKVKSSAKVTGTKTTARKTNKDGRTAAEIAAQRDARNARRRELAAAKRAAAQS
jgi:hypothetical protein